MQEKHEEEPKILDFIEEVVEIPKEEEVSIEVSVSKVDVEIKREVKEKETSAPQNQVIADRYQTKITTVGDKSQAITDIRKAISVMDRFLYMKELFGNSQDIFNDALDGINASSSLQEAVEYLSQFNWEDNDTSSQFMKLVTRRFA